MLTQTLQRKFNELKQNEEYDAYAFTLAGKILIENNWNLNDAYKQVETAANKGEDESTETWSEVLSILEELVD